MKQRDRLVSRPITYLFALALAFVLCLALLATAAPAAAGHRRRAGPPPSDATLSCIRQFETGGGVPGRANYADAGERWNAAKRSYVGYATAYQMDDDFARAYSTAIPDEHWDLWGASRGDPPWLWHPMIQDEVARNGYRARRLGPWPTPSRRCTRLG